MPACTSEMRASTTNGAGTFRNFIPISSKNETRASEKNAFR